MAQEKARTICIFSRLTFFSHFAADDDNAYDRSECYDQRLFIFRTPADAARAGTRCRQDVDIIAHDVAHADLGSLRCCCENVAGKGTNTIKME